MANSEVAVLDLEPLVATNHNGGAIHFGNDGKLYVAVGENAVGAASLAPGAYWWFMIIIPTADPNTSYSDIVLTTIP